MKENNWNIDRIKSWLIETKDYFNFLINETRCEKWHKWKEDRSTHIYPCVCKTREEHCIFIETYYKFDKVIQVHNLEEYFGKLGQWYKQASKNNDEILMWLSENKQVFDNLEFASIVEITTSNSPYKTKKYKLEENEFQNIIEFRNIYIHELYLRSNDK